MVVHGYRLFQNHYGTPEMRQIWAEENMVQKWLDCEKALALSMADLDLIPVEIAREIAEKSSVKYLTPEMIAEVLDKTHHLGVSLVKAFANMCGEAAEYYHLGLTTQDVLLTGLTLQIQEAHELILRQLLTLENVLLEQASRHQQTIMMGRTHAQHAVPLTFGFILASWAYEVRDHIDRFQELEKRLFRAKLTAAVGTRNTWVYLFGLEKTRALISKTSDRLGLDNPPIDIQTRTDRLAEIGFTLANLVTSLAKIGLNIRYLNAEEIREVEEPWDYSNQYSSSTMPNKRNPENSEWLDGLAKIAQGNAGALLSITILNERDATRMGPTFKCIADNFLLASAALTKTTSILKDLRVNKDKMRQNLHLTDGLAMAEALMLKLWQKTGRKVTAHTLCRDLAIQSVEEGVMFKKVLLESPGITQHLTPEEIESTLAPENYCGDAVDQVKNVIEYINQKRQSDDSKTGEHLNNNQSVHP